MHNWLKFTNLLRSKFKIIQNYLLVPCKYLKDRTLSNNDRQTLRQLFQLQVWRQVYTQGGWRVKVSGGWINTGGWGIHVEFEKKLVSLYTHKLISKIKLYVKEKLGQGQENSTLKERKTNSFKYAKIKIFTHETNKD